MKKVSIIIPIFNALDYLKKCLESIEQSNCHTEYEIILINDSSTDTEVSRYLETLKFNSIYKIFNNQTNLGFVKTCNKGIKLAGQNDVLLLNSDTEVTKGFLDKIVERAYSAPNIGTVTPMSNCASILSIPNYCIESDLPANLNKDIANKILENTYYGEIPILPTANGFCMFIKREVINIIGFFDEENFGMGYGEENDFSLRANEASYLNVADTSTFIYHKAHASFKENKTISEKVQTIKKEHSEYLHKKYPYWQNWIEDFVKNSSIKNKVDFFNFIFYLYESKSPTILIIKHYEEPIGGVGYHSINLAKNIKDANFLIIWTEGYKIKCHLYTKGEHKIELNIQNIYKLEKNVFLSMVIKKLHKFINFHHIHFQHLFGLDISMLKIGKEIKVTISLTLHDLFLINNNLDFIFNPTEKDEITQNKIYKTKLIDALSDNNLTIIAPSNYIKTIFLNNAGGNVKIEVIENGIHKNVNLKKVFDISKKYINIAFLGVAHQSKGINEFLELISKIKKYKYFRFYIIGKTDNTFLELAKKYKIKLNKDIKISTYANGMPYQALAENDIDIVIIPTKVKESFSLTLSESLHFGVPVFARNIGAIGQRLTKYGIGWFYSTIEELEHKLLQLYRNRNELTEQINKIKNINIPDLDYMLEKYKKVFKIVDKKRDSNIDLDNIDKDLSFMICEKLRYEDNRAEYREPSFKDTIKLLTNKIKRKIKNILKLNNA